MSDLKRRIRQIAAAFIYLMGLLALTGQEPAAATENIGLTVQSQTEARPGETVRLSVNVEADGFEAAAMEFWLQYDSERLVLTDVSAGGAVAGIAGGQTAIFSPLDERNYEPEGSIFFQWDSIKSRLAAGGSVLDVCFEVKEGASGDIPINLSGACAYDSGFNEIPLRCSDGVLAVSSEKKTVEVPIENNAGTGVAAPPDDGWTVGDNTFTVTSPAAPVVLVSRDRGKTYERLTAVENKDGVYTFKLDDTDDDTAVRILYRGDLDDDGVIQAEDVRIARRIAAHLLACEDWQAFAGDVNEDGKINVEDVGLIRRYAENQSSRYSAEETKQ